MRSIQVSYNKGRDDFEIPDDVKEENWIDVCEKFNDDVHRIRSVENSEMYNALYECINDENKSSYYLVDEDEALRNMKRKTFLRKLGRDLTVL